jgi:putative restriction endonuclease
LCSPAFTNDQQGEHKVRPYVVASLTVSDRFTLVAKAPSVKWTREHFLIALNLYCKLPFGKLDKSNPIIIDVAQRMGRTPSSLAMKLCNFASLDPVQQARGIRGLPGATKQDREMWDEFRARPATLGPESEQLLHDLFTTNQDQEVDFLQRRKVGLERSRPLVAPTGPTESLVTIKARRGQQFFRQSILTAYGVRCCITGINVPSLLRASHIKPWSDFADDRLDPCNGLCLSALHDAAFDSGLITLDEALRVVLSKRLQDHFPQPVLEQNFAPFATKAIRSPEKLAEPYAEFLMFHRQSVFAD